jgi:serine/threonine protein kinase HipA of HipAB toxin-antitoxin module
VLIGNGDMPLKNWLLIYPDQRWPILAPAYDLFCIHPAGTALCGRVASAL